MVANRGELMAKPAYSCIATVVLTVLLSACDTGPAKPTLNYHWGDYDSLVYDMYAKPGEATPVVQISKLSAQIEETKSRGEPVPPGVHAHLGYMQYISGNTDAAVIEFEQERAAYPESAVFIDGIIRRLNGEE